MKRQSTICCCRWIKATTNSLLFSIWRRQPPHWSSLAIKRAKRRQLAAKLHSANSPRALLPKPWPETRRLRRHTLSALLLGIILVRDTIPVRGVLFWRVEPVRREAVSETNRTRLAQG